MSLKRILTEEYTMFEIGDLIVRGTAHLNQYIDRHSTNTSHLNKKEFDFFYEYLEKLNKLYHNGGQVYRLVIAPSEEFIKNKGVGVGAESNSWTLDMEMLPHIYSNIMGDFLAGHFEPQDKDMDFWRDDIQQDEVKTFLITADTPPRNIDPKDSFIQCLSFPEEKEVIVKKPNKLNVKSIEEYKK